MSVPQRYSRLRIRLRGRNRKQMISSSLACILSLTSISFVLDVSLLTGRIVDRASLLSDDVAVILARDFEAHETKTSIQVAVLILPSSLVQRSQSLH